MLVDAVYTLQNLLIRQIERDRLEAADIDGDVEAVLFTSTVKVLLCTHKSTNAHALLLYVTGTLASCHRAVVVFLCLFLLFHFAHNDLIADLPASSVHL